MSKFTDLIIDAHNGDALVYDALDTTGEGARSMYDTIEQITAANAAIGRHFFEPSDMRCYRVRVSPTVYGGKYFITSEQFDDAPRLYTVRMANPTGSISTVGEFQQYATRAQAVAAIRKLIAR